MSKPNPCHCSDCSFFVPSAYFGIGWCEIRQFTFNCKSECFFNKYYPSPKEAERILHYYQKWRRGANIKMPHPYVIGVAIDEAIRTLRKVEKRLIKQ